MYNCGMWYTIQKLEDEVSALGKWWQEEAVYQIYPMSFCDSDNDGYGDLKGIISKLDYIRDLGVGAIWLSPVYASPMEDNGYDISDYRAINPMFGTMEDMDELIRKAHEKGLRVIMDMVINHTSSQHEWFRKSCEGIAPYDEYYIWKDGRGKKNAAPNNWNGFFGGDVWEYSENRKKYYLHLFAKGQPDLNYSNPKVLEEIKDIFRFWCEKGIDGFRCDVINIIYKESFANGKKGLPRGKEHYITTEGCHSILREIQRDVLSKYDAFTVGETVFADTQDAYDLCFREDRELDELFYFDHTLADARGIKWFRRKFSSQRYTEGIAKWMEELPWNANALESHDLPRSISKFRTKGYLRNQSGKMLATLLLTLRGTPFIYQGEEIGMSNADLKEDEVRDVETKNVVSIARKLHFPKKYIARIIREVSRDNARTPMQWSDGVNGGFSLVLPWIKVNPEYETYNVEKEEKDGDSILNYYKTLLSLRKKTPALVYGSFETLSTGNVFAYRREYRARKFVIALNFTDREQKTACSGKMVLSSSNSEDFSGYLKPYEAVILEEN